MTTLCAAFSSAQQIEKIYHKMPLKLTLPEKIDYLSKQFINAPYQLGVLGEGEKGLYDQSPLFQSQAFDCQTFVETVLALSQSNSLPAFQKKMNAIRYKDNTPDYLARNHFISLDWIPNNTKKGFIKDITPTFLNEENVPVFLLSKTLINKNGWLLNKTVEDLKISNESLKIKRLKTLKSHASAYPKQNVSLPYLPLTTLFNKKKQPNLYLFKQIPNGSIINIVRPNWQLEKLIGTDLDVSHLGFAIWKKDVLYFREASTIEKKVVDLPLINYLESALTSPTIKGINILKVLSIP